MRAYEIAKEAESCGQAPFKSQRLLSGLFMTDLLQGMIDLGSLLRAVPVSGGWVEIDSISDLDLAERLVLQGRLSCNTGQGKHAEGSALRD